MTNTQEQVPAIKVGQVWADNDRRSEGRKIRVIEVDATHATVELVDQRGRPARGHEAEQRAEPGRQTRIRLDRFRPTSTGYRLIQESDQCASCRSGQSCQVCEGNNCGSCPDCSPHVPEWN